MPFINSKVTMELTPEKKQALAKALGKAIVTLGKPESYLMLGFEDKKTLFFGGKQLDKGAFVSVKLLGSVSSDASNKMTAEVCDIFKKELDIPGEAIYITYQGIKDWGWNGSNF